MQELNEMELEIVGGGSRIVRAIKFVRDAVAAGVIYDTVKTMAESVDVSKVSDPMDTKLGINQ